MKYSRLYIFFCDVLKWIIVCGCCFVAYGFWVWEIHVREGLEILARVVSSGLFLFYAGFILALMETLKRRDRGI